MAQINMGNHPNRIKSHAVLANCPHCGNQHKVVIQNRHGSSPMVVCNYKGCYAITSFMGLEKLPLAEQLTETIRRYNERAAGMAGGAA